MKKTLAYASLMLLSFLAACPKRQTTPDYDQIRQDSDRAHKQLDQTQAPGQMPAGQ